MTDDGQFDETIGRWLEQTASTGIPERVLLVTFERTRGSRQHVGLRALLGRSRMTRFMPALGGAAVVVTAAALVLTIAANRPDDPGPVASQGPSPEPSTSVLPWPQATVDEAREAQELADAGDPRFTWQVDPDMRSGFGQPTADTEIVARFLRQELGWEEFRFMPIPEDGFGPGVSTDNAYVRCAAGGSNPLYASGACAPTRDDGRFERVALDLAQPVRQDASGIWVVTRAEPLAPFEQSVPPSEADTTALLEGFIHARIDGTGAADYLAGPEAKIPFLYATASGAGYERGTFDVIEGPVWPGGGLLFRVRMSADDGAEVEQLLSLERLERGLMYASEADGPAGPVPGTTVDGQVVPVPYSFLGGGLTLDAAYPWHDTWDGEVGRSPTLFLDELEGTVVLVPDALASGPGCGTLGAPADASELARGIRADTDLMVGDPVPVNVGGVPALQVDVTAAAGAVMCDQSDWTLAVPDVPVGRGDRARLYLLDLPGASSRILAIAIVAPDRSFERVIEAAAPVIESIEFSTP